MLTAQSAGAGTSNRSRLLILLLAASSLISYIDRGILSVAAPLLTNELSLSPSQLGILLSAFFWTYSTFQLVSGWLVDRFDVTWVMAAGFLVWSAATAGAGIATGFGLLLAMRLLLGAGESVTFPSYSKIFAARPAEHQRGLANALIDAGAKCGPAFGTFAGGVLMARFGWRPFFIVLGLASLLWLVPWFKVMPRQQGPAAGELDHAPSAASILARRSAWATFTGHFCSNYFWYFLLTWLPFYLVRERNFSIHAMATVGGLAYLVSGVSATVTGWLADRAIAAGATPTRVRKTCTGGGLAFCTLILPAAVVSDVTVSTIALMVSCIAFGVYASSHWAITQTIAGPSAAGKWSGMQNFVANMAGVVAPALTGLVLDQTGQFFWAFALSAAIALAGAFIYVFALGPVEPANWGAGRDPNPVQG